MTIAYFDCFNGASGDMIVGALLAAGADLAVLERELAVLPVAGLELHARRFARQGIYATKFDVVVRGQIEGPGGVVEPYHDHHHGHEHHHEHRDLAEVEAVLDHLPAGAREPAKAIFRRLAESEARVHGTTAESVHFHEVGMDDAIVDVASAVLCLRQLGVTEVHCSPLPLGSGMVRCAHGMMPVPVPAVVHLMEGFPSYDNGERGELVTPTGAAILTTLATRFGPVPAWTLSATGYGAGSREGDRIPNLLRVMLGEPVPAPGGLVELAANLDDMNPQFYGPLTEKLLAAGALDVTLTPTVMKKGRPGIILAVLCAEADRGAIANLLFRETTTLGVRHHPVTRIELERELTTVETPWGPVAIKRGRLDGEVVNIAPEFEDCRALAERAGVSLKDVWQEALSRARRL